MKLTKFQIMMRGLARYAYSLGALQGFQIEQYENEAFIGGINEENFGYVFPMLNASINRAYACKEEGQLSESERLGKQETVRLIEEYRAYQRNKRLSCPPALQFALWDRTKAARKEGAIKNWELRSIRKQMREADKAQLRGLLNYVEKAVEKEAKWRAAVKEENRRQSCPPKEAFELWEDAKKARQMRLITNAEVRECREIKNWGDNLEIARMRAHISRKIYTKTAIDHLKKSLKHRQETRAGAKKGNCITCS